MWLLLEKFHGHIALLGAALCFHPWVALLRARRPSWATRLAAVLASVLVIVTNVLGWVIYPAYREGPKLELYRHVELVGVGFEVKEHLAFFALCLAVAGAAMAVAASGPAGLALRAPLRTTYAVISVLMVIVCALGVWVATYASFPDLLTEAGR
jgi:magnesium-transporting ATPase (P-type)